MKRYIDMDADERLILKASRRLEKQDDKELAEMIALFEEEVNQGARSIMRKRILTLLQPKGQKQTISTGEVRLVF